MDLQTETLVRKRYYVRAIRITDENMIEVAKWCGGRINTTPEREETDRKPKRYIRMPVSRNHNRRRRGFAGDWVLQLGESFQVYSDESVWTFFERPEPTEVVNHTRAYFNSDPELPALPTLSPDRLNSIAHRFFGDAEYNAETDSLEIPSLSMRLPAKIVAQKVNAVFQEEQRKIEWERQVRMLLEVGPGVFENYTLTYYLDGKRIGNVLPEGHDCFEKNCTVETTPDPLAYEKNYIKFYHHELARITDDIEKPDKGIHISGDGPWHSESECGRLGC